MADIGIFFGTDSGRTRKIAKLIGRKLGDRADAPVNVVKAQPEDLLRYPFLILGTPTYGEGVLPGLDIGSQTESWAEFLPRLEGMDFSGQTIAFFGLGEQERYPDNFLDGIGILYDFFLAAGARCVGEWPAAGYTFVQSVALIDDHFIGLGLDLVTQDSLTESRLDAWLAALAPHLPK